MSTLRAPDRRPDRLAEGGRGRVPGSRQHHAGRRRRRTGAASGRRQQAALPGLGNFPRGRQSRRRRQGPEGCAGHRNAAAVGRAVSAPWRASSARARRPRQAAISAGCIRASCRTKSTTRLQTHAGRRASRRRSVRPAATTSSVCATARKAWAPSIPDPATREARRAADRRAHSAAARPDAAEAGQGKRDQDRRRRSTTTSTAATRLPKIAQQIHGMVVQDLAKMGMKITDLSPEIQDAIGKAGPGEATPPFMSPAGIEMMVRCDKRAPTITAYTIPSRAADRRAAVRSADHDAVAALSARPAAQRQCRNPLKRRRRSDPRDDGRAGRHWAGDRRRGVQGARRTHRLASAASWSAMPSVFASCGLADASAVIATKARARRAPGQTRRQRMRLRHRSDRNGGCDGARRQAPRRSSPRRSTRRC